MTTTYKFGYLLYVPERARESPGNALQTMASLMRQKPKVPPTNKG